MKIPKQARRDAKQLFRSCQVDGLLREDRVRQAVKEVSERKPRGYLVVLHQFQRLVRLDLQRRSSRVESAVPLPEETRAEVRKNLTGIYGPGLEVAFAENESLIGGMRVRVGSDVLDGSIRRRLDDLAESF